MYSTIDRPRGGGSFAFSSLGPSFMKRRGAVSFLSEFYAISLDASSSGFRGSFTDPLRIVGPKLGFCVVVDFFPDVVETRD